MSVGQEETTPPSHVLRPHVELFRTSRPATRVEVPLRFQEQFHTLAEGIYPQESIKRMRQGGYNPTVLGYDHPHDQSDLPAIKRRLTELKAGDPERKLKVAHEIIPPIQLQYIKDFLTVSEEYKTKGTMRGKIPDHVPEDPEAYRAKLRKNHAEHLALWMLEQGFEVVPLESPDVQNWISEDNRVAFGDTRQAITAIKRDAYGLEVMDRERPDIITSGNAHALKYDLLLERDGSNSHYFLERIGNWNDILNLWQKAHQLHLTRDDVTPNDATKKSSTNYRRPGPDLFRNIFEEEDW